MAHANRLRILRQLYRLRYSEGAHAGLTLADLARCTGMGTRTLLSEIRALMRLRLVHSRTSQMPWRESVPMRGAYRYAITLYGTTTYQRLAKAADSGWVGFRGIMSAAPKKTKLSPAKKMSPPE